MTRRARLSVYCTLPHGNLRAATGSNQSSSWQAGDAVPAGGSGFAGDDPSIAVTVPALDRFVVFARVPGALRYCLWNPTDGFGSWTNAWPPPGVEPDPPTTVDKPWVVRRSASDFLVFYWRPFSLYRYMRSTDGEHWSGTPIDVVADEPVSAAFCVQPAIGADGTIYLAHATGGYGPGEQDGKIRILIGQDGASGFDFLYMRKVTGAVLELAVRFPQGASLPVPYGGGEEDFFSKTVPYVVCDPSNPNRLYIAYHDSAPDDPDDMNIYVVALQRSLDGSWSHSTTPVRVNDDPQLPVGSRADQFTPAMIVDSQGRIHVIFYDNRAACGGPGLSSKYDVYYALSTDGGQTFTNVILRSDCEQDPTLDAGLRGNGIEITWAPREYSGIAIYESGGVTRVWVTYAGTLASETGMNRTVMFGQQILISN